MAAVGLANFPSPYARAAPELIAMGYHALPICPGEKAPGEYRGGQWRRMSEWQRFRDRQPTDYEQRLWARNSPDANIGLVMGSLARPGHHVIAIDIDIVEPDELDAVTRQLPHSPMRKRGMKGETRFYIAPETIKSRSYSRASDKKRLVDTLTGKDTRQTVVPPSIHKDTGQPYVWLAGPVPAAELPIFDEDARDKLEEALGALGWNPEAERATPRREAPAVVDEDDYFTQTKATALANLDAWVPGLDLHGCKRARGGFEAVATWRPSSTGRPVEQRKRNLSIQANGIKDFGTGDTYSAIDLVMAARGVEQAAATSWLRERLGLDDSESVVAPNFNTRKKAVSGAATSLAASTIRKFNPSGFSGEMPPPRPWAYGAFLMYGTVSAIAAPPGVGKTTFAMQLAIAYAMDLRLGPWTPRPGGGGKVWLYNGEEPKEELDRRYVASCMDMNLDPAAPAGRVSYSSSLLEKVTLLTQDAKTGNLLRSANIEAIKVDILEGGYKLLIIDPLIEFHSVKEIDTEAFKEIGAVFREIAVDCDCAVLLFHHTPKSANSDTAAGDANALRGGGSLIGVARFVSTMFGMSKADAKDYGISADQRPRFVRFDDAKANMALIDGLAGWWTKIGIDIDNPEGVRPSDEIGILRYVVLQSMDARAQKEEATKARRDAHDGIVERLGKEIVRVCREQKWTHYAIAGALNAVLAHVNLKRVGAGTTKARNLILEWLSDRPDFDGVQIVLSSESCGAKIGRRLHIEPIDFQDFQTSGESVKVKLNQEVDTS